MDMHTKYAQNTYYCIQIVYYIFKCRILRFTIDIVHIHIYRSLKLIVSYYTQPVTM